ncbi:MAG: hypothetical protein WCR42_04940 [bacterium]
MNHSQSYIDFIEGNLAPDQELQFAQNLATDEEFRSGFKGFMEITNSINANASTFAPTIAETSSIYQKLGYALPNAAGTAILTNHIGKVTLFQKPLQFILTAIPTALVTFIITWLLLHNGTQIGNSEQVHTTNTPVIASNLTESANSIQNKPIETQTIVKYIYVNNYPVVNSQNADIVETTQQEPQTSEISEINSDKDVRMNENSNFDLATPDNSEIIINPQLSYVNNSLSQIENPQFNTLSERKKLGLSFEIRNAATWNLPKETISPSYLSKFSNMALSLFYNFNRQWALGLDLRQETFFLKYDSWDEFQQQYIYEQQPNFVSYGIVARYSPIVYHGLKPYIQANISRNNFGVITRANTGLQYELYPNFDLTVNLEYSYLFFNHQNTMYNGKKIGLNYGINYKF